MVPPPGSRAVWGLPGSPERPSFPARVSEVHCQERKKKKEREKEKRKLSCQIGKIFSSCSLAGEAAGNRDHEVGSGHPEPGGSATPAPGGRPPTSPCSPCRRALRPALSTPLLPNLPPCPGEPLRPGLEPSAGGGRGKSCSAGWLLRRVLLNPDISPSHLPLHLPRGPAHPERSQSAPGAARTEVLHILGRGERCWRAGVG